MDTTKKVERAHGLVDYFKNRINRRAFARRALLGSAGLAAAATLPIDAEAQAITDTTVLQFALNLEYLEAEFYTVITTGLTLSQIGIDTSGVGTQGPTLGGARLALGGPIGNLALELAADEQAHVRLLRSALGTNAIAKPTIDFRGAGVVDEATFVTASRIFEDVGVSAYIGAAPLLTSKDTLSIAARILGTEAEHTGAIRFYAFNYANIRPTPVDRKDIVNRIISAEPSAGLTTGRPPGEVLAIVFGSSVPGTSRGGFFPDGVNGLLNRV